MNKEIQRIENFPPCWLEKKMVEGYTWFTSTPRTTQGKYDKMLTAIFAIIWLLAGVGVILTLRG